MMDDSKNRFSNNNAAMALELIDTKTHFTITRVYRLHTDVTTYNIITGGR